jgi:hypothetical protein
MATGLKVWTNGGSVLTIDQSYENLSLYSSGTAQTSSANPEVAYGLYTLTLTLPSAAIPQLALRTHDASKYIGIVGVTISGSTYSFLIRTAGGPVAFDWYIFSLPAFIAPSTRGLKAWRQSDNRLVFDSGMKWMRVAGQIIGDGGMVQLDPSRQYTYVAAARIPNGLFQSDSMMVHAVNSSPGAPPDIGLIASGVAAFLALDVTGF